MFVESNFIDKQPQTAGWIEVICGCMFSGKTEELIRRITRAKIARQVVSIFKPALDNRYHSKHVISHNANAIYSSPVDSAMEILTQVGNATVVGIDEVQFFDADIVRVCIELANQGRRVIVAGLDTDYKGEPFGYMPQLMAVAEYVSKIHAICMKCGSPANFSHRLIPNEEQVLLGETDAYEALCRRCFNQSSNESTQVLVEVQNEPSPDANSLAVE
jgi:thymidine kinase